MISRFERFVYNITEIDLYWHRLSAHVMKRYGLKGSYAIYFITLHNKSTGMAAVDLSAMCCKDKADVSRDMNDLEHRGLIRRVKVGGNGYRAQIFLTEDGMRIAEDIISLTESAVSFIDNKLSEEERDGLFHSLDEINSSMREFCDNGLPE